ncbi:hypothetical protein PVK06_023920 [Gossypium arboreum]|uniref:Aminotransferase-like plant mobile domain-containing protein n=1 Tax=Gossypium arboreum TaxID=29729 RepID=A0ABR0PCN0_GOSAR|nr:hypothetical protein PVK06_023920 [Gossypium arboreum]
MINVPGEYWVLKTHVHTPTYESGDCVFSYLNVTGIAMATLTMTFELRPNLVSTLVERWGPETHTFHLSCKECIITLEDVALQLELPVDEAVVKGLSKVPDVVLRCYQLLGQSPTDGAIRFST